MIFEGSDFVLVKESDEPLSPPEGVYKIRKEAVQGVFRCGQATSGGDEKGGGK
jgi:hypothetical protein